MKLRPVLPSEASVYSRLRNGEHTYQCFYSARQFSETEVAAWLASLDSATEKLYFAEDGGRIVGTCAVYGIDSTARRAEVGRIIVDESMRKRGLGAVMLGLLIEECRKLGLTAIFANIKEENAASQRLFLGAGFRLVERRTETGGYFEKWLVQAG
jgi:RimJ/RimL family protein N-acetyltransferase